MQFKKIRTKMLVYLLPVTIILLIALFGISYQSSKKLIDNEIVVKMNYKLDATIATIQDSLNKHGAIAVTIARTAETSGKEMSKEQYKKILPSYVATNADTLGLGVWFEPNQYQSDTKYFGPYVYRDGGEIVYTDEYNDPAYDYFNQPWYSMAVDTTLPLVWSDPFYDGVTKTTMVTAAAPFYDQNKKLLGVTTADMNLESLQKIVKDIKIGETGTAFLLNKSGLYIVGNAGIKPMETSILKDPNPSLAAIGAEIISGQRSSGVFTEKGGKSDVFYAPIPQTGWVIGVMMPQAELYQPLNAMLIKLIIVILFIILIISLTLLFFSSYITKNINKVVVYGEALGTGDLSQSITIDATDEIGTMAHAFEKLAGSMRENAHAYEMISAGDLSVEVIPKSEKDVLSISMNTVIDTLRRLAAEAGMLAHAAVDGKLDVRGDSQKFNGVYQEIVTGMNRTLDAVIGPLNVAAEYMDRISKGDIPARITDNYHGDFNEIKNNLNVCIDSVNALVADAAMLAEAAVAGKLDTRADAGRHSGDFRKIIIGVNNTLDSVIGPLNVAAEYVDRISKGDIPPQDHQTNYNGDFNDDQEQPEHLHRCGEQD